MFMSQDYGDVQPTVHSGTEDLLSASHTDNTKNAQVEPRRSAADEGIRKLLDALGSSLDGRVIVYSCQDEQIPGETAFHVWSQQPEDSQKLPPVAVVQVQSEQDVLLAVPVLAKLDAEYNIPFRIQSGGHHYDGLSSVSSGIVLSLRNLNSISIVDDSTIDDNNTIALIEPGARVIDMLEQVLQPHSYGAVVGACPSLGEGGYILGGGFSYYSRLHGLGVDNVLELQVVVASGELVQASSSHHSDLFWAMRGAGSAGFGVVTSFKYRLFPSQDKQLYGRGILSRKMDQAATFVQSVGAQNLPGNAMVMFFLFPLRFGFGAEYFTTLSWYSESDERLHEGQILLNQTIQQLLPQADADSFTFQTESWMEHSRAADMSSKLFRVWNGFLNACNNTQEV